MVNIWNAKVYGFLFFHLFFSLSNNYTFAPFELANIFIFLLLLLLSVCYWFSTFSSVCGYGNFVDLKTLENQESGFLVDDSLIVQVTFDVVLADTDSV